MKGNGGRPHWLALWTIVGLAMAYWGEAGAVFSQIQAVNPQIRPLRGGQVSPVYEGWYRADDGQIRAVFGYFNRNTSEVVLLAVGNENKVEPGPQDQGQPTRFLPGRQSSVFSIPVPGGTTEVTWTLASRGSTFAIPAFLDPVYIINPLKDDGGFSPGNTPPTLQFDASGPKWQGPAGLTVSRSVKVSEPLTLTALVADDGLPPPRGAEGAARPSTRQRLTVRWQHFRGTGAARFEPETVTAEQGRATTVVTFDTPGEHVLYARALDGSGGGGGCCSTNGYVKVTVMP